MYESYELLGDNVSNFLFARRYLGEARCALEREMECLAGWGQLRSFGGRLFASASFE